MYNIIIKYIFIFLISINGIAQDYMPKVGIRPFPRVPQDTLVVTVGGGTAPGSIGTWDGFTGQYPIAKEYTDAVYDYTGEFEIINNTITNINASNVLTILQVYPNPVSGVLYVELANIGEVKTIQLLNTTGEVIVSHKSRICRYNY
jgi:hypothetical protein